VKASIPAHRSLDRVTSRRVSAPLLRRLPLCTSVGLMLITTLAGCVGNKAISWTDPRLNPQFQASFVPNFESHGSSSAGAPYWIAPTDIFHVKWNSLRVDVCAASGSGPGPLYDFCAPPAGLRLPCATTTLVLSYPASVLGGLFATTPALIQTWSWPSQNPSAPGQPIFTACLDGAAPSLQFSAGGTYQVALTLKDHFDGNSPVPADGEVVATDPVTGQPATLSLINLVGSSAVVLQEHIKGIPFRPNFSLTPTADGSPGGEKRWLFDTTSTDFGANFSQSIRVTQVRVYSDPSAIPGSSQTVPFCYVELQGQPGARCDSNCSTTAGSDCSADLLPGSTVCQSDVQATPAFLNGPAIWVIGFDTPNATNSRCPVPNGSLWINFTLFHIP
jgi:hypothetical protein